MDQQIHLLDANHQVMKAATVNQSDNALAYHPTSKENHLPGGPPKAVLESSVFAVVAGVLMSGSLFAAVGALLTAITRVLG